MNWVPLALLSGLCAATNGLFAKLTTTALTTSIAHSIAGFLGLESQAGVEVVVRGVSPDSWKACSKLAKLHSNDLLLGVLRS